MPDIALGSMLKLLNSVFCLLDPVGRHVFPKTIYLAKKALGLNGLGGIKLQACQECHMLRKNGDFYPPTAHIDTTCNVCTLSRVPMVSGALLLHYPLINQLQTFSCGQGFASSLMHGGTGTFLQQTSQMCTMAQSGTNLGLAARSPVATGQETYSLTMKMLTMASSYRPILTGTSRMTGYNTALAPCTYQS